MYLINNMNYIKFFLTYYIRIAVSVSILLVTIVSPLAYGASSCITDPYLWDGTDNRCDVTATITPSSFSVSSGGSVTIIMYASTLYQWFINGLVDVGATMTDSVTGSVTTLSTGPTYITGNWSTSVSSGPLTHSVILSIWAESDQGIIDTDSSIVSVTSAPTVNINFSFMDGVKEFFKNVSLVTKVFAKE